MNVREIRRAWGKTQFAFAEILGVSEITVRRWEIGLTKPRAKDVAKLKALVLPLRVKL